MTSRTAESHVPFLLDALEPGMRVLDVGCGPGTITRGLAHRMAPGEVVGLDVDAGQVELAARAAASEVGPRPRFVLASVEALPFPDASFDAVLAHAVLEHLSDPVAALAEIVRVLRPGGLLAAADSDWSQATVRPDDADLREAVRQYAALRLAAGGDPFLGGRLAALVREAGLVDVEVGTVATEDLAPREMGAYLARRLRSAASAPRPSAALAPAVAAAEAWGSRPDAQFAQHWTTVLARRPAAT